MTHDSDSGEELAESLPEIFPRDKDSDNYKLFQVVGHEVDDTLDNVDAVDRATTVQHADTVAQLDKLGEMVDVNPREGEKREHYRARVISEYQLVTCEGSISDIINSVSTILDTDPSSVEYSELAEDLTFRILAPKDAIDSLELSDGEIAKIINDLSLAGGRIEVSTLGTLEYVSESTYDDIQAGNDSWSNYPGYDGLDADGNPKGGGGTYAGRLN